ncbi:MAG TPA: carboxypeptidase regulatory-like domain-containing protein [Acidobacteriaceae bacterium]|nr:carboxypeptidase regulatory-like domain-containing protein [Acidobacteriaceae bacterium]
MKNPCPRNLGSISRLILALSLAFFCTLVLPGNLKAQSTISGAIAGTVTDASGAAIPGATVKITNTDTGATQTLKTGGAGDYRAALLKPGNYLVVISAQGFQTTQRQTAAALGQTATVSMQLGVAKGIQTVEVEGQTVPLLQPENSDLATTITMNQVQSLPNPGGDITYYINMTQGVVMNTQGGYGNSSAFGLPATSNNFTVNGAQDNDPFLNLNNSGPSNLLLGSNDIDEVNIVANAYSAQYGGLGGVQENILTRSGSNKFHGNATYWWTNSAMNANSWFNDYSSAPEAFSNANQWGAAVGGPIVKDKSFFFVNYEGLRFVTAPTDFVVVPSQAYETAVLNNLQAEGSPFSDQIPFYQHMFDLYNNAPGASRAQPYGYDQYANDGTGMVYSNFFVTSPKNHLAEVLVTARYDQKLGPNDSMFVHFKRDHGVQPTYVDPINSAFNNNSDQPDYEGQLEETHTFSPNFVNQFLLAGAWYSAYFVDANPQLAKQTFPYTLDMASGSFSLLGGITYVFPQGRDVTQYQIDDDLSYTHGKHNLSAGFIFKRNDVTDADLGVLTTPLAVNLGPATFGVFSDPCPTNDNGNPIGPTCGAYDMFGQGLNYLGIQNFPQRLSEPIALYSLGFYGQDQWKLAPNFQVTAGVRVEHNSNPICVTNCFARLNGNYNQVNAGLDVPYNKMILSGLHTAFNSLQKVTIEPRLGFTFSPPNHPYTLFRGGIGMFSDVFPATVADSLLTNAPLNPEFNAYFYLPDPSSPYSFTGALAGVNQTFVQDYSTGGSYNSILNDNPDFTAPAVTSADSKIHYPTYEEWSLQLQQQIGRHTSFQIGYVGNHGYHEPVVNNGVNAALATSGYESFPGLPDNPALPAFSGVNEVQSVASSNYNGLVATVKEESKYVTAMFNYTWSHALDEISNGGFLPFGGNATSPIDPFNLALLNYGNADYDLRHNLNGNYIIHIPYFGGPKMVTDGWMLGGTVFYHTGFPFSVTSSSATNTLNGTGGYGGTMLAAITNPSVPHHCGGRAITTSCLGPAIGKTGSYFADPSSFYGVQRRNQFFGPGYFNTDFTVGKSFAIPGLDTGRFQVAAQAYNVLNHPNFGNPVFNGDNGAGFGTIQNTVSVPTSVYGSFLGGDASARIIQLKANIQF